MAARRGLLQPCSCDLGRAPFSPHAQANEHLRALADARLDRLARPQLSEGVLVRPSHASSHSIPRPRPRPPPAHRRYAPSCAREASSRHYPAPYSGARGHSEPLAPPQGCSKCSLGRPGGNLGRPGGLGPCRGTHPSDAACVCFVASLPDFRHSGWESPAVATTTDLCATELGMPPHVV